MRSWRLRVGSDVDLTIEEYGDPALPAAALGHGAGSLPSYVAATFGPALSDVGLRLVTWYQRGHGASTSLLDPALLTSDHYAADVAAVVAATGARVVGGISLGAHSAARFAAGPGGADLDGLLVAAPGWLGAPDLVAAANALQADELETSGLDATLERVHAGAPPWLAELLESWWRSHDPASFITVLRTLAKSDGPGTERLGRIDVATGVAGLHGDPLHPAPVAAAWAAAIPGAVLHELTLDAVGADASALGRAAVTAWQEARAARSGGAITKT